MLLHTSCILDFKQLPHFHTSISALFCALSLALPLQIRYKTAFFLGQTNKTRTNQRETSRAEQSRERERERERERKGEKHKGYK